MYGGKPSSWLSQMPSQTLKSFGHIRLAGDNKEDLLWVFSTINSTTLMLDDKYNFFYVA